MNLSNLKIPRDLIQRNGAKMLIYGGAGTGKTRSVITAPRPVLLGVEQGLISILNENVPVFDIHHNLNPNMSLEDQNAKKLANIIEFFEWISRSNEAKNFDTVYIDSISEISSIVLKEEEKRIKDGRQAYKSMADFVLKWIKMLHSMPNKHVVLIAKQESVTNNNITYYQPSFEGKKLFTETTHLFDEIFRFQSKRMKQGNQFHEFMVCSTRNTPDYLARDKTGKLAEDVPQNIGEIINILMS